MNQEDKDVLEQLIEQRKELIEYILTHDLQEEKHYMKFLELQDINLEIKKIELGFDFNSTEIARKWRKYLK